VLDLKLIRWEGKAKPVSASLEEHPVVPQTSDVLA
jgi:hypothetical protein